MATTMDRQNEPLCEQSGDAEEEGGGRPTQLLQNLKVLRRVFVLFLPLLPWKIRAIHSKFGTAYHTTS